MGAATVHKNGADLLQETWPSSPSKKGDCATACLQAVALFLGRNTANEQAVAHISDTLSLFQRAASSCSEPPPPTLGKLGYAGALESVTQDGITEVRRLCLSRKRVRFAWSTYCRFTSQETGAGHPPISRLRTEVSRSRPQTDSGPQFTLPWK